jgi:cytochrome P450 family 135
MRPADILGGVPLPPGPRAPAAVNTVRFVRRPLETLYGWHDRYGDVFTVKLLVFGTGVYVADPAEIKAMFTGDQSTLLAGEANAPLSVVLGEHSVLVLDGAEHMRQRKLLLPRFQGAHVGEFREVIREVAEAEVGRWRDGERLAMRERMRALTFDVICRAVFGVTEPARVERLRSALLSVLDMGLLFLLPELLRRIPLGPRGPWARFRRRLAAADALLYEEIAARRAEPDLESRTDVLSLLLRARDEDGEPMTDVELRDELFTMLGAGHETTATALAFAVDLLLHNPATLARLRDEIGAGDDAYLDAVGTETLRLRPVIDAAERKLTHPRRVGGFDLPAGIRVYPGIALVHRRPDLYPEPDRFRPERFLDGTVESYAWIPFGGGIRRCIGAALAKAEIAEVLRVICERVELEPIRPEMDPVVLRGITLVPKHGPEVRVARRLVLTGPGPRARRGAAPAPVREAGSAPRGQVAAGPRASLARPGRPSAPRRGG